MAAPTLFSVLLFLASLALAQGQSVDTAVFFCSVLYGNPASAASTGSLQPWTVATSGFLNLTTLFNEGALTNAYTIGAASYAKRVYTPAGGANAAQVTTAITGLAASSAGTATLGNYLQNQDPRELTSTGVTFTLAAAATFPGAASASAFTLLFDSAVNQYREAGAEAPLYSSFQFFPVNDTGSFDGNRFPPCSAFSDTPAAIAANPSTTTLTFAFCYALNSPLGQPTSGWFVRSSGLISVVGGTYPDLANGNSPYQVYNMYNTVGTRTMTLNNGSAYTSNIIGLEPFYEGVADGGPDNQLFAGNSAFSPQWYQNGILVNDNKDGFIWGPTYLDGNGFSYNMYPSSPIAGSVAGNFPTQQVYDINFYWNRQYREVNEPNHQDPQGLGTFVIQPYNSSISLLQNIPSCPLPTLQWSFCSLIWGNPNSTNSQWAVATSGIITTDPTPIAQLNPLRSQFNFSNLAYRIVNLTGTRTFYTKTGAASTVSISTLFGARSYYKSSGNPFSDEAPLLYIYEQNQDGRSLDVFGFTYFTSTAGVLPNGTSTSTFTLSFNALSNGYSEAQVTTEAPLYSYFQYVPVGSSDVIPSCTPFSNSAVTVYQFCYTLAAAPNSNNGPWQVGATGLMLTTAQLQVNYTLGGVAPLKIVAFTGVRTIVTGTNLTSTSNILALEPLTQLPPYYNIIGIPGGGLPDGGPDNRYFPLSQNYSIGNSGPIQLEDNGFTFNLFPPTYIEGTGAVLAQTYQVSDVAFYWNAGNYREVNEPNHQEYAGPAVFNVTSYSQGQVQPKCGVAGSAVTVGNAVNTTGTSRGSTTTTLFSFCYLAYASPLSPVGAWSTAISGLLNLSNAEFAAASTLPGSPAIPYQNVVSIAGTRTYISPAGVVSTATINPTAGAGSFATSQGRVYRYIHDDSLPLQDSRQLDANGFGFTLTSQVPIPGASQSFNTLNLRFAQGQYIEVGTTGSGLYPADVPGLSSFSIAVYNPAKGVPACYPQTSAAAPPTNNAITPPQNVAVASWCYTGVNPVNDPSGPWSVAASGFFVLNATLGPDTGSGHAYPDAVYTITSLVGTRTFVNASLTNVVSFNALQDTIDSDGGTDNELYNQPLPAGVPALLDDPGFTGNTWPPAILGSLSGLGSLYYSPVTDVAIYWNAGSYREVNEGYHESYTTNNTFSYQLIPAGTQVSMANLPQCFPPTQRATASICFLFYALPGNVEYPWSVAISGSISYVPSNVTTKQGTAVTVLSGSGVRTFTNRFGATTTTAFTIAPVGSKGTTAGATIPVSTNLFYLTGGLIVDAGGWVLNLTSPVQLPGYGPNELFTAIQLQNIGGVVAEYRATRVDGPGSAFLTTIAGFTNQTIGASNINSLAANYATCQAPLTFTNGLRQPTQPSASNGGTTIRYSYFVSDGASYSISCNLTLTTTSAFATTTDLLGNPYQTISNVAGTRTYTYLPTGQTVVSVVSGLTTAAYQYADQRFYPYALISSAPGVYSMTTAPFVDYDGIEFGITPSAPTAGAAPGTAPLYNSTSIYLESPELAAVLVDGYFITQPLVQYQQQYYSFT